MATFKSPEVIVNKSAQDLFNQIGDLNNLKEIIPSGIKDFKSTETTCSFKINDMLDLALEITEKIKFSKISLSATSKKTPFSFDCFILEKGKQCQARLEINAELNMMTRMMIEKPLNQFLEMVASKIQGL